MSKNHHGTVCKTCRKRGKKCDKLLPACSTCIGKGITCEGYTFRWSGVASRGKLAGKKIPVPDEGSSNTDESKAPSTSNTSQPGPVVRRQSTAPIPKITWPAEQADRRSSAPSKLEDVKEIVERDIPWEQQPLALHSANAVSLTILEDIDNTLDLDFNTLRSSKERHLVAEVLVPSPTWTPSRPLDTFNIPPEIRHVVDYFLDQVSPRLCVDMGAYSNPYSQYILPLAFRTPSLLYACAALAACQIDIREGNSKQLLKALKFKGKSMKRLQECLYSDERAKDPGTVATILMLSLCDLSLGAAAGTTSFDAHFSGAKRLIDMRGAQKSPGNFVEQYIAWLDTMAATSSFRKPIFSATEISEWTKTPMSSGAKAWSYDVFPCPVDHFLIINELIELYKSQEDPDFPTSEVLEKVRDCKARVMGLPMQSEREEYFLNLTEAYRFAIVLYLIRLFHIDRDKKEIDWLTDSVFHHIKCTPPLTGWADQMLWPLFHAALELEDEERRRWIRERSKQMLQSGGFRNVECAMDILERVWAGKTSATNYMELISGDGNGCLLFV